MAQTSPKKQTNAQNRQSPQLAGASTANSQPKNRKMPLPPKGGAKANQTKSSWWQTVGQRWNNISFRNKLAILVVGSVAVPVIALGEILTLVTEREKVDDLQTVLNLGLDFLENAIENDLEELEEEAQSISQYASVTGANLNNPSEAEQVLTKNLELDADESFYIITNPQGKTVAQRILTLDEDFSTYPALPDFDSFAAAEAEEGEENDDDDDDDEAFEQELEEISLPLGIPLGDLPIVKEVLQTGAGVTSVELVSHTILERLGLAEQAAIGLRGQNTEGLAEDKTPFPEGTYDIEQGRIGMVLMSVQPVIRNNQLVGTVIQGTLLNRNYEIVDEKKIETDVAVATLFAQDWRVSTNAPYSDETTRAIGTRASRKVAETVLNQGETYIGGASIITTEYLTAYSPISNHKGEIIGIAAVGDPKTSIDASLARLAVIQYGTGALILLGGVGVAFLISRNVSKPIIRLSNFAQDIGGGNYGLRMEETNRKDEIGTLSQDLNRMVANLEATQDELRQDAAESAFIGRIAGAVVTDSESANTVTNRALAEARELMKVDRVVIYRFQEDGSGYISNESSAQGLKPARKQQIKDPCIPEAIRKAYLQGRVVPTSDVLNAGFHANHRKLMVDLEIKANLVVPIVIRESLYGLLIAHKCYETHEWQDREINFLQRLSQEISRVLERSRLLQELQTSEEQQRQEKEKLQRRALDLLMQVDPVSKGDLTINASVTEDEIGTVADSYNSTIESLRKIVAQVKEAATAVGDTTTKNEAQVQALSQGALKQSEEIEVALQRIEAMTETMNAVSASATEAESAIQKSSATVKAGDEAMNRTVDGIVSIRQTVAETAKKVKRLGESSQKISQVVNLIGNFADQTNLLALNASIEAARAGEQGRGFAVVADEVRALAQQSANATSEISNLVDQIQTETNEVVAAMEQGTEQVVSGTQLVEQARGNLNQIAEVSNQINELVAKIAQAAKTQSVDSEQVNMTIKEVAAIAQQTSESALQVSHSFKELLKTAQNLEENVERFKLEPGDGKQT
ncbi:methyl-accepting chemotaxis sensory transducer with GAF sensor [Halothece sp. PCC 7418]|uniref:methyl-accepting chemotaxis protein n=1 Tax=Halothece sp. (strain PCC 7418) TaxID=65093 RepID=UPI0002A06925|nr:methyl-accepting chemotaxis protein [Halothece sp. PCC 7418]AFZ42845.1 methyl-accepting chemotaxis sensory transducer with GAF sensor [Halothece sp. PCC 7418]